MAWWQRCEDAAEAYEGLDGHEGYFLTDPPTEVLPFETVMASIARDFYRSLPGVLTGAGLFLTFVSILSALHGVHYDKANAVEPITGIDILINGLSGKFLSSVVALLCSILFTFFEHSQSARARKAYADTISTLRAVIPRLTTARILLDIRKSSEDASVEVKHISSDVVARFTDALNDQVVPQLAISMASGVAGAFQQQLSPTLDRMTGSLDTLQGAIVGLEAQKQSSVTGEFERLLHGLERSMTDALGKMASGFQDALSGSARHEFTNMQATLEATRGMLSAMNDQFGATQASFNGVIARAEETTMQQVAAGREQTEQLHQVMRGVLASITSGTADNMQTLRDQLKETIDQLVSQVELHTRSSQDSASTLLGQAASSSQAMTDRLEGVLNSLQDRSSDFEHASQQLTAAQGFISALLQQNGTALQQLGAASAEVRGYTADLRAQAQSLGTVVSGQVSVADRLSGAATKVQEALNDQEARLNRYASSLQQFEKVMEDLDKRIAAVLQEFGRGFNDYQASVSKNFDSIVKIANELIPRASTGLETRVAEFTEQMTGFTEAIQDEIKKVKGAGDGRVR
ncbi:Methyl-accepting chemotaxis protein [Bryocella elongata]|uniref:Methyl-accepting chemotaxis protein n=2 Tax=Bryocella elongata TaxID=863522 RepID=A0A1H6ACZ8_9BACT|nr:Methyl-accepting chemotaxis protein [Bryocella elongata]